MRAILYKQVLPRIVNKAPEEPIKQTQGDIISEIIEESQTAEDTLSLQMSSAAKLAETVLLNDMNR